MNRIENLTLNVQDIKWTPGTIVTSRFSASDVADNTGNKVLSPKLKYTVGVVTGNLDRWTAGDGELSPVQGLNINPTTGIVTIDRTFTNPYGQYWCVCKPTDYSENRAWVYATFSVRTYTSNIGQVALYVKDGDKYKPIMQAGKISSETEIYATVKDKTGKYLGFNNEPYSSNPSYVKITHPVKTGPYRGAEDCNIGGGGIDMLTYEVSSSAQYPTAPYLRTVTFMAQDGTKAMASYTENYSNGSTDEYDRLRVNIPYIEEILTETNKTMDVTGHLTPGDYIEIALVNSSRKRPEDNGVLAEGSLLVVGATVLERHNNQYMSIVMNSPKATITLVKGIKRTVFTITDNTYALTQPIAPVATNTTIKNNGKEDRVYSGYEYKKDDEINIKLAQPLKLDGLDPTKLSIVLKGSLVDNGYLKGEYDYNSYVVETAANGIKSAKLVLPLENGMKLGTGANTLKVIYKYTDGGTVSYLTRTVTTVTIIPIQFSKTYSIVPSLTMTYYPATGTSPECAVADKSQLKYVGTGVDHIEYTGTENYNTRGVFNTFKDEFIIDTIGNFVVNEGEILNNKNILGVPQATTGWIRGTVHFKDGSTSDFISKVNITFVKAK